MKGYFKYFDNSIRKNFPEKVEYLIAEIKNNYMVIYPDISFSKKSLNPLDKRMDISSCFLALIKTLDKQGIDFETTRKICHEIALEYVKPKNKLEQYFKKLPVNLLNTRLATIILKKFQQKVRQQYNPKGFSAEIITDKNETYDLGYGVDILECGIHKLFQKHHYQKFTQILCEVDAITSGLAGLELVRSGTIATGSKKCDFRFKKISKNFRADE